MKNTVFCGAATAIVTPLTENGIDFEQFGRLIEWQIDEGIDAIVVVGTTGEGSTLSDDEHKDAIRFCVDKVAGRVPVIAGTGSNDAAYAIELSRLVGDKMDIYSGNDDQIVPVLSLGGKGVISVLSNIMPAATSEMCKRFFDGDTKGACKLQLELLPLVDALFCEVNPIPVKAAVSAMGYCENYLRLPLTPMEKAHEEKLLALMKEQNLI